MIRFDVSDIMSPRPEVKHPKLQMRRDRLRALELCINGPLPVGERRNRRVGAVQHGPVVKGGKCQRCLDIHSPPVKRR